MYIKASELPTVIPDNDFRYFTMLEGIINSVDSESSVHIMKKPNGYNTRITPSSSSREEYTPLLNLMVQEITKFHTVMGIQIDLSKSIKSSGKIFYEITM